MRLSLIFDIRYSKFEREIEFDIRYWTFDFNVGLSLIFDIRHSILNVGLSFKLNPTFDRMSNIEFD